MTVINDSILYVLTESAVGTYVAPVQATDIALRVLEEASFTQSPGLIERTVPGAGGAVTDRTVGPLRWDMAFPARMTGITDAGAADWLPLAKAAALGATQTAIDDGVAVTLAPQHQNLVVSGNSGTPRTASFTLIQGGYGSKPLQKRARGCVFALDSIVGNGTDIRWTWQGQGLNVRSEDESPFGSVVSRGALRAAGKQLTPADSPEFSLRLTLGVDGGESNAAEAVLKECLQEFTFATNATLTEAPCMRDLDGFAPSLVTYGTPTLAMTIVQPEEGADGVWRAMLDELEGVAITLTFKRTRLLPDGTRITWNSILTLNRFQVVSVDDAGTLARQFVVTFIGKPSGDGNNDAWSLRFERTEIEPETIED